MPTPSMKINQAEAKCILDMIGKTPAPTPRITALKARVEAFLSSNEFAKKLTDPAEGNNTS
jgi:hypothetical protein